MTKGWMRGRRPARLRGGACGDLTASRLPLRRGADAGAAVAAAQAGWRGLAGGVIEATVRAVGVAGADGLGMVGVAGPVTRGPAAGDADASLQEL